jgi:hypothetical protein
LKLRLGAAKLGEPQGAFSFDERLEPFTQYGGAIKATHHFGRFGEQVIVQRYGRAHRSTPFLSTYIIIT